MICRRPSVVRRGNCWLDPDQRRVAELRQLDPPVAVRGQQSSNVDLDAFETVEAVHPGTFDRHLAFNRHAEGGEEGNGGWEVVDDDADMVHSLDCHVPSLAGAMAMHDCTGSGGMSGAIRNRNASGNSSFARGSVLHDSYSASLPAYVTVLLGVLSVRKVLNGATGQMLRDEFQILVSDRLLVQ
jgi:hypothetical protein